MVYVKLIDVTKRFGEVIAVDKATFTVNDGELFTLLGPSGCGKTTTLRIIAGFEYPDEGRVFFGEEEVTYKKPYERGTAMVFQNYALWPHMTVFDNVAYGLKLRKLPANEIKTRVMKVLELVGLKGLEKRYPLQLSGGQQQRVALARALVVEPKVLLLDEPLSNLDAKLRLKMREEIKRLQKNLKITTIYVTHDQEEAMSLSDRIAVMNKGKILQIGHPKEVYNNPRNLFVATFIGRSTLLRGRIIGSEKEFVKVDYGGQVIEGRIAEGFKVDEGEEVVAIMRPEDFSIEPLSSTYNIVEGEVLLTMFLGPFVQVRLKTGNQSIFVYVEPENEPQIGSRIKVYIRPSDVIVFPLHGWEDLGMEALS